MKAHQFLVRTFVAAIKCNLCTSLMVGMVRQGVVCEGMFCLFVLFAWPRDHFSDTLRCVCQQFAASLVTWRAKTKCPLSVQCLPTKPSVPSESIPREASARPTRDTSRCPSRAESNGAGWGSSSSCATSNSSSTTYVPIRTPSLTSASPKCSIWGRSNFLFHFGVLGSKGPFSRYLLRHLQGRGVRRQLRIGVRRDPCQQEGHPLHI